MLEPKPENLWPNVVHDGYRDRWIVQPEGITVYQWVRRSWLRLKIQADERLVREMAAVAAEHIIADCQRTLER